MLVGLLVTLRPRDRPPAAPGKDADPKEYPWYFEWSRTMPGGDRRGPISGGWAPAPPLFQRNDTPPERRRNAARKPQKARPKTSAAPTATAIQGARAKNSAAAAMTPGRPARTLEWDL